MLCGTRRCPAYPKGRRTHPGVVSAGNWGFPQQTRQSGLPLTNNGFGTRDAICQQALPVQVPAQEIPPDGKCTLHH